MVEGLRLYSNDEKSLEKKKKIIIKIQSRSEFWTPENWTNYTTDELLSALSPSFFYTPRMFCYKTEICLLSRLFASHLYLRNSAASTMTLILIIIDLGYCLTNNSVITSFHVQLHFF